MAGDAVASGAAVIHGEGMRAVEARRYPGAGVVAGGTVGPKKAAMVIWISVAGGTLSRCSGEDAVLMACGARQAGMRPREWEGRLCVVKCDLAPGGGGVTQRTILSELAVVCVVFLVAAETGRCDPL